MNIDVLKRIIRATRNAFDAAEALSSEKLFNAYDDLVDAVLLIYGEQPEELTESITFKLIHNRKLTDEQAAEMLLAATA